MAEIVADGISKRYPDGSVAVAELDLHIADGEFLILVGPSGAEVDDAEHDRGPGGHHLR